MGTGPELVYIWRLVPGHVSVHFHLHKGLLQSTVIEPGSLADIACRVCVRCVNALYEEEGLPLVLASWWSFLAIDRGPAFEPSHRPFMTFNFAPQPALLPSFAIRRRP